MKKQAAISSASHTQLPVASTSPQKCSICLQFGSGERCCKKKPLCEYVVMMYSVVCWISLLKSWNFLSLLLVPKVPERMIFFNFSQFLRPRDCYYFIQYNDLTSHGFQCLIFLFLALLSPNKPMSRISSTKKIQSSWKISDSSKIYPNEVSMRDSKTLLPEKFSPVKNHSKESRIFNSSRDKINLLKNSNSQSPAITPRNRDNTALFSSNHLYLKDSTQLQESPKKSQLNHPQLTSKQSLILKNLESDSPQKVVRTSNFNHQLLKSTHDYNRQAINKIKTEFYIFRAQIWTQLMEQREMITKMASELGRQLQVIRNSEDKRVQESVFDCIKSVDVSPKIESINEQINAFTGSIGKYEHVEEAQAAIEEHLPYVEIVPFEQQYIEKPINPLQSQKQVRTPIIKLEQISKIPQKRSSPLDKCTHIAETIGILNQINSSPVSHSRAKSIEKLSIQEYKQKLLSICRSNQQLIKQPTRSPVPTSQSQLKLKGNFKLDKFYSAIQKLKSQVNQIRNINQMKQIKKLKIVQVSE